MDFGISGAAFSGDHAAQGSDDDEDVKKFYAFPDGAGVCPYGKKPGNSPWRILLVHVFKNGFLPVLTFWE